MKYRYDKTDDILMIWLAKEPVDYAEKTGDMIVHFTKTNKPVLLEVLNASDFLLHTAKVFPPNVRRTAFA